MAAFVPNAIQLLRAAQCTADVADAQKSRAMAILAELLHAQANVPMPAAFQVPEPRPYDALLPEATQIVASYMPNVLNLPMAQAVQDTIRELLVVYRDPNRPRAGPDGAQAAPLQVNVADARQAEEEQRYLKYVGPNNSGVIKVFRNGIEPATFLYPHHAIRRCQELGNPTLAYNDWLASKTRFFANLGSHNIPAQLVPKHDRYLQLIKGWFLNIPVDQAGNRTLAATPFDSLKQFLTLIELLLEILLMSGTFLAGTFTTSTGKLWELIDGYYAGCECLDYVKAINQAKMAAPSGPRK